MPVITAGAPSFETIAGSILDSQILDDTIKSRHILANAITPEKIEFSKGLIEQELRLTVVESNLAITGATDQLEDVFDDANGLRNTVDVGASTSSYALAAYRNYDVDVDTVQKSGDSNTFQLLDTSTLPYISSCAFNARGTQSTAIIGWQVVFKYSDASTSTETGTVAGENFTTVGVSNPNPNKQLSTTEIYLRVVSLSQNYYLDDIAYFSTNIEEREIHIPYTGIPAGSYLFLFSNGGVSTDDIGDCVYFFTDGTNVSPDFPVQSTNTHTLGFTPTHVVIKQENTAQSEITKYVLLLG